MQDIKTSIYNDAAKGGPAIVVKRDPRPDEINGIISHVLEEVDWLAGFATESGLIVAGLEPDKMDSFAPGGKWRWDHYQIDCLDTGGWYASNKPRQGGISTVFAAKAFARGILTRNNYNAIFTSFKKEEAVNKINYVRQFLEALPPQFRKKILRAPQQLIEWENINGTRSKIMSHAQRPIRGINGDIFLDELAFYTLADEIYVSALPAVAVTKSTIDVTSTPFGASGKFWEILTDGNKYSAFTRHDIKWWDCKRYLKFTNDDFQIKAYLEAPKLTVEERVYKFGSMSLIQQFENSQDLATFMQEFEGHFVDVAASFFHREMIINCMFPTDHQLIDDYAPVKEDFTVSIEDALDTKDDFNYPIVKKHIGRRTNDGREVHFRTYDTIEDLHAAIRRGEISDNLFGGVDVGKSQHSTHFVILEELELDNGTNLQIERFTINRPDWDMTDQQNYFDNVLTKGILRKMRLDRTGLGEQMGQYLEKRHPGVFEGIHMGGSNARQEEHMINLRARLENMAIALAYDKRTLEDLHSIRRVISASKSIAYRAPERSRSHADSAWAIAFASLVATPYGQTPGSYNTNTASSMSIERLAKQLGVSQSGMSAPRISSQIGKLTGLGRKEIKAYKNASKLGKFITDHDM